MSPFEHVQAALMRPSAIQELIGRVGRREPLLHRLGRCYRERYLPSADSSDPVTPDWEVRDLETQVGMEPFVTIGAPDKSGWVEHVVTGLVGATEAQPGPQAVLVLGQAGAGKGVVAEELSRYFLARGSCVAIDRYALQYLHPNYAALVGEDDRAASRAVFSDVVDLVEALYHRTLAAKRNLILDGSLMDAPSASVSVRELQAGGYRPSVLVLCVPPDASWRAVQERFECQRRAMGFGRAVDRESHDESCRELLAALRALEEQGLADEIHLLSRTGEGLLSSFRDRDHVPGRAEQVIRACWGQVAPIPTRGAPAPPPAVIQTGGRKIKVGSFRTPAAAPKTASAEPSAGPPVPRDQGDRGGPATERKAVSKARAPQTRQHTPAEERAIERRRKLQAKLRSKVKPREENG